MEAGEHPLTPEQCDVLRGLIEQSRAEAQHHLDALTRALETVHSARGSEPADDEHDPEGPTLSQEWSSLVGRTADARADLAALDAARERIDDKRYGICERCGSPIGFDRLQARPAATLCIACARLGR